MDLQTFARDVVPLLQLGISALGLLAIVLLWWQMRQAAIWNKLRAHHSFFKDIPSLELDLLLQKTLRDFEIDYHKPLTDESLKMIEKDIEAIHAVKAYLNEYEELCAAVNVGTVDEELAFATDSARVIHAYSTFERFIAWRRELFSNNGIYLELEKLSKRWLLRKRQQDAKAKKRSEELKEASVDDLTISKRY